MKRIYAKLSTPEIEYVLKTPSFLFFILSVTFSQIAFNMMNVVLIFLVYYLSQSNLFVSLIVLTAILPQVFLSFIGGVVADIKNKKKILIVGNIARAFVVILLFLQYDSLPLIYIVALIISVITQFYVPAETPIIPKLVDKKYLISANAIFGVALFGSILVGYVLAGPLVDGVGRSNIFLVISILFIISSICVLFVPTKLAEAVPREDLGTTFRNFYPLVRSEFKRSILMLRDAKHALNALMLLVFSQVVILILATIIPGYSESILKIPAEKLSLILFAPAALGMILASFTIGSLLAHRNRDTLMNIGIFLSAAILCLFPFTMGIAELSEKSGINSFLPSLIEITKVHVVIVLSLVAGIANAMIFVPSQATIQEHTPEEARSKIYGLMYSMIGIISLVPIIIAGGIADLLGVGVALFTVGLVIFFIGFWRVAASSFNKKI